MRTLLLNGDPDGLAFIFGLHDSLFQFVEPLAGVEHLADFSVLANEDAALGVLGGISRMDADALPLAVELWTT